MYRRIIKLPTSEDVANTVAEELLSLIADRQQSNGHVNVCLTGGDTANKVYERLAERIVDYEIDFSQVHFWWGDERFVAATNPLRNSLQAIERLARTIPLHSTHIHMMAPKDGHKDAHECAVAYENELGDTYFDVVLLGIGADGHCASMFPDHPSSEPTNRLVIGVENASKAPADRISLTTNALNRTPYVWFIATGQRKASAVARAIAGDEHIPAAHVHGERGTLWFLDDAASAELPHQYECDL